MLCCNENDDDDNIDEGDYYDDEQRLVGHGGALVETMPFDRRVVGSNPALAVTHGP